MAAFRAESAAGRKITKAEADKLGLNYDMLEEEREELIASARPDAFAAQQRIYSPEPRQTAAIATDQTPVPSEA